LLGAELTRRAIEDARFRGGFDAVALMGDLLEDGAAPHAAGDLDVLRAEILDHIDVPVLVVPGNHDNADAVLAAFGFTPGLHEIGDYRFLTFADQFDGNLAARGDRGRQSLLDMSAQRGGPIIVLQHNPMNPAIESDYPYMLTNRPDVMSDYARAGVTLSISGHYHAGQELNLAEGVGYFTAPALCELPFRYAIVTFRGAQCEVEVRQLSLPASPPLIDCHAHTEFAYCGQGISADGMIDRARLFGAAGLCIVEHAPQLYCSMDDFWVGRHIANPALWRQGPGRMARFREEILPKRSDTVRVGLEVELDADFQITLRDEDLAWPEVLLGAVHFLPVAMDELDDAQLADLFMRICRGLIDYKVDVLAHPWRLFSRGGRVTPTHLYGQLAAMLAAGGVAAEINLHKNPNDPQFIRECIDRGVKIAFGSDSHAMHQACALQGHLDILRQAAGRDDVEGLLWWPRARR